MEGSERKFAERFRLSDRRARARAGNNLCGADQKRFGTLSARWKTPRISQPQRRERMGRADQRSAAKGLLRKRAPRRDVGRFSRSVRDLFRNDRRTSLRFTGFWRQLGADR